MLIESLYDLAGIGSVRESSCTEVVVRRRFRFRGSGLHTVGLHQPAAGFSLHSASS